MLLVLGQGAQAGMTASQSNDPNVDLTDSLTALLGRETSGLGAVDPARLQELATAPVRTAAKTVKANKAAAVKAPAAPTYDEAWLASLPVPQENPQFDCLATALYFEARGESLDGQLAVGRVVVERANSGRFPNSYCGVVYQPSQFSFVRGRSMPAIRESSPAWSRAVAMARIADQGSWDSPTEGALFFHATHVSPKWRLKRLARIDNHVFYR